MNSYFNQYLTIEVLKFGTIWWGCSVNEPAYFKNIQYRKNGGSWITLKSKYAGKAPAYIAAAASVGDKFEIKATSNQQYGNDQSSPMYYYNSFGGTAEVKIYGNILSLTGINVTTLSENAVTSLNVPHQFAGLFLNYTNLKDVKDLWLSVDQLSSYCYAKMFEGCTGIEQAPELLTENLTYQGCYEMMFYNCSSLNFIKCTAKYFGQFACNSWTHGVDTGGHFVTADDISFRTSGSDSTQNDYDCWIMNENGIPKTWTISTLSEYEGGGTDPGDQGGQDEQDLQNQKYKLNITTYDSIDWPSSASDEKVIIKVDGGVGHKVIISNENNTGRKYPDFYKYDDSNYAEAFSTNSPRPLNGTNSRKVSFEKAFVNEYNDSRSSKRRPISGFQSEFNKFFASNSFTNPSASNNAFAYLRANVINKSSKYYKS